MNEPAAIAAGGAPVFCARRLNAPGVEPVEWPGDAATVDGEVRWLHLDRTHPRVAAWLHEESGIDPVMVEALLEPDPRPRFVRSGEAMLLVLRTANVNPGAQPEELVSVRAWAEPGRIIVLRNRHSAALEAFEHRLFGANGDNERGETGAIVAGLVTALVDALEPVVEDVQEQQDLLEDRLLGGQHRDLAPLLGAHRREVLQLHRYLAPQREVLLRLDGDRPSWLSKRDRNVLREAAHAGSRLLDDLLLARDHGVLLQEELSARAGERLNRRLYLFTVIASIFLPLTFLTGLLGSNVEGIPFASKEWAFAGVVVLCLGIATFQWLLIRRLRLV